jgi:hypothetical protein
VLGETHFVTVGAVEARQLHQRQIRMSRPAASMTDRLPALNQSIKKFGRLSAKGITNALRPL